MGPKRISADFRPPAMVVERTRQMYVGRYAGAERAVLRFFTEAPNHNPIVYSHSLGHLTGKQQLPMGPSPVSP